MLKKISSIIIILLCFSLITYAQKGATVRGNVYDQVNGQPIPFANIILRGTSVGATTDLNGFFQISNAPDGTQTLVATFIGYDSVALEVNLTEGGIIYKGIYMTEAAKSLDVVEVSGRKEKARTTAQVSQITITPKQLKQLPSVGGEPDIAQYLTVLPGIISSGDQGGQIFIRGGSPIQNKILLDGMTIFNPFHSIGFFSVFETEAIRSVDVLSGGFNAEYGGRIGAVVDIKTKEGNKKRLSGLVSGSPFQAKVMLEGPLVKLKEEDGSSLSFVLTGKQSILPQTSKTLYKYASRDSVNGLPFDFKDYYGKISFVASGGSKINVFGFNHNDAVMYPNVAQYDWKTTGYGANFTLVPAGLKMIIGGGLTYSKYTINLKERDPRPRSNGVTSFAANLDFTIPGRNSELKYGAEVSGFSTEFKFPSPLGFTFDQTRNTSEIAGFVRYRKSSKRLVLEPSLHLHGYTTLGESTIEPRFAAKLNATDNFRFKFSGGLFSQNMIASVSEKDVVNLFVGFLSGPDEQFKRLNTTEAASTRLQKAWHGVGGFEIDVNKHLELNIEGYMKKFTQLIDLNRLKKASTDDNYVTEEGDAKGVDVSMRYENNGLSLWSTYSLTFVNRFDGVQEYPTNFDRRHNVNLLATYAFGKNKSWEFSARWNFGTGFPFTLTQGFYGSIPPSTGVGSDILTTNPDLGIIYSDKRNGGRLPDYHRLDISLRKAIEFTKFIKLDIVASATNAYDRSNIFYFDRINYSRVNQLPILPSLAATLRF
jgi:CarboxypepD_reg-like domain/TonB-dependent Receptor Plug Domain